jgi:hypothetical protein
MRKISSEKADEIFQELSAVYGQSVQRCIPGSGEDHFHVAFDRQVDINHNEILQTVRKNHTDVLARWL